MELDRGNKLWDPTWLPHNLTVVGRTRETHARFELALSTRDTSLEYLEYLSHTLLFPSRSEKKDVVGEYRSAGRRWVHNGVGVGRLLRTKLPLGPRGETVLPFLVSGAFLAWHGIHPASTRTK